MNKQDVTNEAKQHITTRFTTMTHNEFERLQLGDGTISVVDETLDMLPVVFRIINPEVKQIVEEFDETDIEELVQHCITLSNKRYNYFSAMNSNDAYAYLKTFDIDFDVILDCEDTKSIHEWIEYAITLLSEVTKDLQTMDNCDDIIKQNRHLMMRLYDIQYIDILWDDEAKYRRIDDDMPYCTRLAEKCAQRLFKNETIKED